MVDVFDVADALERVRTNGEVEAFARRQYEEAIRDDAVVPDYTETIAAIDSVRSETPVHRKQASLRRLQELANFGLDRNGVLSQTLRECVSEVRACGRVSDDVDARLHACQRALQTMQEAYETLAAKNHVTLQSPNEAYRGS